MVKFVVFNGECGTDSKYRFEEMRVKPEDLKAVSTDLCCNVSGQGH